MEDNSCKTSRWRNIKAALNNLTAEAFKKKITAEKNVVVIDVRTEQEYRSGHITGAVHINYLSEDLWEELDALSREKQYLVYCQSGRRSLRVCMLMKNGGFAAERIFNLSEGLTGWMAAFPDELTQKL